MLNRFFLPVFLTVFTGIFAASGPNIEHIHNVRVDKKGNFKRKMLADYLKQSEQLKSHNSGFAKVTESQIKHMSQEAKDASWGTSQLFKCYLSNDNQYIIKEIKASCSNPNSPIKEIERLELAKSYQPIANCVHPNKMPEYPQFIFPIAYLSYTHGKNRRYVVVMPSAKGNSLMNYMTEFQNGYKKNNHAYLQATGKSYFYVGRRMSRFYEYHRSKRTDKSTILHGDFHMGNIFFDSKTNQVTLIDNESVCRSFNSCKSRAEDIAFLTLKSMFVSKWNEHKLFFSNHSRKKDWYDLFLPCFIAGYLSTYDQKYRFSEFKKLKGWIKSYKDPEDGSHWYTNTKTLGFSHKSYMDPVFSRIENSKIFFSIDIESAQKYFADGRTLLHDTAKNNGETICIWPLIAAGASINATDNHDNIPLHEAAWSNRDEALKRLIYAGSNKQAKDRNGHTAQDKAKYNNSHKAIDMLNSL